MKNKRKILIINNNMKVGGVQKALISVLYALHEHFDITLLLFYHFGALLQEIPEDVRVIETKSLYRYVGMAQGDCKTLIQKAVRAFFVVLTRINGFKCVLPFLNMTVENDCHEEYVAVISFLHCGANRVFYGGTAEYALQMKNKGEKICYIHCDYEKSGTATRHNSDQYRRFDKLVCVSEGVKKQFLKLIPDVENKTFALQNPIDINCVVREASVNTYEYNKAYINLLTVARLSHEKGIDRLIKAMGRVNSPRLRYYIVGDGKHRTTIERTVRERNLTDQVFLLGEDKNPYRFMVNADLLVVPSYHEAAPVVYQEALALNLPVFSTRTLSTDDMVGDEYGFIVENTDAAIEEMLHAIVMDSSLIDAKRAALLQCNKYNKLEFYKESFSCLINDFDVLANALSDRHS